MSRPIVVGIDYGHGGLIDGQYQNTGKQYTFTDHGDHWIGEGLINRRIAAKVIGLLLRDTDAIVVDCVADVCWESGPHWYDLDQRDASLRERVKNANAQTLDIFVSLHSNAIGDDIRGPSRRPRGVSFFTSPGQTVADDYATAFYRAFEDQDLPIRPGHWGDADQDWEAPFYVLTKTRAPAVLAEVGFYTNYEDARYLQSEAGQDEIARCYVAGILACVGQ